MPFPPFPADPEQAAPGPPARSPAAALHNSVKYPVHHLNWQPFRPGQLRLPPASTVVSSALVAFGLAEGLANQPSPWPRPFGRQRVEPFRASSASIKTSALTGAHSPYVTPPLPRGLIAVAL